MQERSKYEIIPAPIALASELALEISPIFHQGDGEITFLHHHNHIEFGVCLAGSGIFIVGTRIVDFQAGDVMAIPATVPHLARSAAGTESCWIWYYLDFSRLLLPFFPGADTGFPARLRGGGFPCRISDFDPEFRHLLEELQQMAPKEREGAAALALLLLRRMQRHFAADVVMPEERQTTGIERIQAALQYFSQRFRGNLSFAHAARLCHVSPVHFRRLFKSAAGVTPQYYVQGLRIAMAQAELHHPARTIGEIAGLCGYRSVSSFNRQFKAHTGVSPNEYRRRGR